MALFRRRIVPRIELGGCRALEWRRPWEAEVVNGLAGKVTTGRPVAGPAEGNGARPLRRRRPLPGGRAVVGGLLVALAAVGTFAGYASATADHRLDYVVASHALVVGHRITAADLATEPMDLPPSIADNLAFRHPSRLVGALLVGPVAAGELIQSGDVVADALAAQQRELSFPVKASQAVDGTLRAGDRVDVLATYGSGTDATTLAVARDVPVVAIADSSASLGTAGGQTEVVTLALADSGDTLALTQAVNAAQVMLVRSTGATPATDGGSYRTPLPAPAGGGTVGTTAGSGG